MDIKKLFELQHLLLNKYHILVNPYYDDIWYVNITNTYDKCDSADRLIYDNYDSEDNIICFDSYEVALEFGIKKAYEILNI